MQVSKGLVSKFFKENEILSVEKFYEYAKKLKIIVYIPEEHVEKVMAEMSKAGAGLIGNYELCSFRTEGIGTFKPTEKANPYSGKKHTLSRVEEVKLEMECDPGIVNAVLDALIKHHPYEEIAYEIYEFMKRGKEEIGFTVNLKSAMKVSQLFSKLNKKIDAEEVRSDTTFKKIAITNSDVSQSILDSAKFTDCHYLISKSLSNKNYKLFKI